MKTRLLTIKTANQKAYEKVLSNWLSTGATIIQCGFDAENQDWWAVAKIAPGTPEKECDIVKSTVTTGMYPDGHWPFGEETKHDYYYDFVMFEEVE